MGVQRTAPIDNSAKGAARTESADKNYQLNGSSRQGYPLCFHIPANQRGIDMGSMQLIAGRKALAYGVKSSRMEESVGNNKRSQA